MGDVVIITNLSAVSAPIIVTFGATNGPIEFIVAVAEGALLGCSDPVDEFRRALEEADRRAQVTEESRALAVAAPVRYRRPPPAPPRRAPWPAVMRSFA